MKITHRLNREIEVWRSAAADDGAGGQTVTLVKVGTIHAKIDLPSAAETQIAAQWEAKISHLAYTEPDADVARGDELRGDDPFGEPEVYRVLYTVRPSRPRYLKLGLERHQAAPGDSLS